MHLDPETHPFLFAVSDHHHPGHCGVPPPALRAPLLKLLTLAPINLLHCFLKYLLDLQLVVISSVHCLANLFLSGLSGLSGLSSHCRCLPRRCPVRFRGLRIYHLEVTNAFAVLPCSQRLFIRERAGPCSRLPGVAQFLSS